MSKKRLQGTIVSNSMQKTVVVRVERYEKHPKYGKYITRSKRYKAHAEGAFELGQKVTIEECPPISRDKRFKVVTENA